MSNESFHFNPPSEDDLLRLMGDRSVIFQDVLNAGAPLHQVEAFCDWANAAGYNPVTVSKLHELQQDDIYGSLARLALPNALGRLRHEL